MKSALRLLVSCLRGLSPFAQAETTNVAAQHPEVVARLTASLLAWHQSMPADNGPTLCAASAGSARKVNLPTPVQKK